MERAAQMLPENKKLQTDIVDLKQQLQDLVFMDVQEDDDYEAKEKQRELQLKKLMTVSKSKYYMLKVTNPKVIEEVDFEQADGEVQSRGLDKDLQREVPSAQIEGHQ